jgi:tungstate transport system substrate-binding protein
MRGDADALLVHDRIGEDKFVAEGYGIDRRDVMYNDFVLVGPSADPAHIRGLKDARTALAKIAAANAPFASRGDAVVLTGWGYDYGSRQASNPTRVADGIAI